MLVGRTRASGNEPRSVLCRYQLPVAEGGNPSTALIFNVTFPPSLSFSVIICISSAFTFIIFLSCPHFHHLPVLHHLIFSIFLFVLFHHFLSVHTFILLSVLTFIILLSVLTFIFLSVLSYFCPFSLSSSSCPSSLSSSCPS